MNNQVSCSFMTTEFSGWKEDGLETTELAGFEQADK